LEIVKLIVSLLTPIIILLVGIWVTQLAERFKAILWSNQKVIEKRIVIYDELAPMLNDLYCYFQFVGNWKELTPPQILEIKRRLDKKAHLYAPLFSPAYLSLYNDFIHLCFETFVGPGLDARLRTPIASFDGDRKEVSTTQWNERWDEMFSDAEEVTSKNELKDKYKSLMSRFSRELGIGLK
jgi:hypothetical protein